MVIYKDNYAIFDNLKFRKDVKTGYYLNSTLRKRLHRYIWEKLNGTIESGFEIHHIDRDKDNNNIENLMLISKVEHAKLHGKEKMLDKEFKKKFQEAGIKLAKLWHKSEEGKEWHRKHYEKYKDKLYQKEEYVCKNCGKKFITNKGLNKYCSNACKSAYRRKSGVDNEERECVFCNKKFITNKYSKVKTCSRKCAYAIRKNKSD